MKSLYSLKPWFSRKLRPVLKVSLRLRISPDVFTLLNIVFGVLAGFSIYWLNPWLCLVAVILRLACANLDGALAREIALTKRIEPGKSGFAKNEIGDRLADFGMLLGLFYLSNGRDSLTVLLAVLVAAAPTLVSLVGVTKGLARINGGPFGKTERSLLVVVMVFVMSSIGEIEKVLYFGSVVIIIGSLTTAWVRYLKIVKA